MRDEKTIREEIGVALEAAREARDTLPAPQVREKEKAVIALGDELSALLSSGSTNCEVCDRAPMGMLKRPGYTDNDGTAHAPIYEVGCIYCPPVIVDHEEGLDVTLDGANRKVKRRSYSARGNTPEQAVERWNAGQHVVDNQIFRGTGVVDNNAEPNVIPIVKE